MPYASTSDLPDAVRDVLPEKAQALFLAAYNNAWNHYRDPATRRGDEGREEVAFKVAWSAVKQQYVKKENRWQHR